MSTIAGTHLLEILQGSAVLAPTANNAPQSLLALQAVPQAPLTTIPVGDYPVGVAVAPNGRAYVANNGNNVTVIDTATNTVIGGPIPAGTFPIGVAVAPNGRAYVTNLVSNNVTVIDTATNTVIGGPIPAGNYPNGVAVAPNGRAYVANNHSNTVTVIDTVTNTVMGAPIPAGSGPSGVAVAPNGRAYVGNYDSDSVTVIDTTTNMVVGGPIPVGTGPMAVAAAPNGRIFVTNRDANNVSVIDSANNTVVGTVPVQLNPQGVTVAANGRAYVTNISSDTVSVLPAPPTLTGISPAQGPTAGGTQVTITGTDLFGATVDIGGQPATNLFYNLAGNAIFATTPPGTAGPGTVTVTTPEGTASLPSAFTYITVPAATALSAAPAVIRLNLSTGQLFIPTLSATLSDQTTNAPLPGRTIAFTATTVTGPVSLGSAVTDANGTASLTNTSVSAVLITASHYTATFVGAPGLLPSSTTALLTFSPV